MTAPVQSVSSEPQTQAELLYSVSVPLSIRVRLNIHHQVLFLRAICHSRVPSCKGGRRRQFAFEALQTNELTSIGAEHNRRYCTVLLSPLKKSVNSRLGAEGKRKWPTSTVSESLRYRHESKSHGWLLGWAFQSSSGSGSVEMRTTTCSELPLFFGIVSIISMSQIKQYVISNQWCRRQLNHKMY